MASALTVSVLCAPRWRCLVCEARRCRRSSAVCGAPVGASLTPATGGAQPRVRDLPLARTAGGSHLRRGIAWRRPFFFRDGGAASPPRVRGDGAQTGLVPSRRPPRVPRPLPAMPAARGADERLCAVLRLATVLHEVRARGGREGQHDRSWSQDKKSMGTQPTHRVRPVLSQNWVAARVPPTCQLRHPEWVNSRWWRGGTAPSPAPAEPPTGAGEGRPLWNRNLTARRYSRARAAEDRPSKKPSTRAARWVWWSARSATQVAVPPQHYRPLCILSAGRIPSPLATHLRRALPAHRRLVLAAKGAYHCTALYDWLQRLAVA